MSHTATRPNSFVSLHAFGRGLAAGSLLLLVLAGWIWMRAPDALKSRQAHIATVTVALTADDRKDDQIKLEAAPAQPAAVESHEDKDHQPPAPIPMTSNMAVPAQTAPAEPAHEQAVDNGVALPPAPIEGLYETTEQGKLPKIDQATGKTPFQAYRRPLAPQNAAGKPVISLVVTDLGLSQAAAKTAMETMPAPVSFAVSPYGGTIDALIAASRQNGHEVWMILPQQGPSYPRIDPGPRTLLVDVPLQDNLAKLNWLMARGEGYAGFIGSYNGDFLKSVKDSAPILDTIYGRGLAYIETSANNPKQPADIARPYASANLWLDDTASSAAIQEKLKQLETQARTNGRAIGILHPLPLSYREVKAWIDTLPQKGYVLAPLSAQTDISK